MGSNLGFADSELVTKSRSIEMAWRAGRKDRPCAPAARAGPASCTKKERSPASQSPECDNRRPWRVTLPIVSHFERSAPGLTAVEPAVLRCNRNR